MLLTGLQTTETSSVMEPHSNLCLASLLIHIILEITRIHVLNKFGRIESATALFDKL